VNGDAATTQLATYLAPIFKAWLNFHEGYDVIGETRQQRASSIELAVAEALEELGEA
jgi:maltooligosyltrehalose synthase